MKKSPPPVPEETTDWVPYVTATDDRWLRFESGASFGAHSALVYGRRWFHTLGAAKRHAYRVTGRRRAAEARRLERERMIRDDPEYRDAG